MLQYKSMATVAKLLFLLVASAFVLARSVAAQISSPSATTKPPAAKPSPSPPPPSPAGFQYPDAIEEPTDVASEDIVIPLSPLVGEAIKTSGGFVRDLILNIVGYVKPRGNELDIPNLDRDAQWLERADPYLTPKSIQEITTRPSTPDPISMASRLCVYIKKTEDEIEVIEKKSDEPVVSEPQLWPKLLAKNTERFNTYFGRAKRANQNYEESKPVVVGDPPECVDQYAGSGQRSIVPVSTSGQNSFGGPVDGILNIIRRITEDIANAILGGEKVPATIKLGTKVPKAADFGCHGPGCTEDDLEPTRLSPEKKGELAKGGFVQTFKPSEVNYKGNPVGMIPNEYEQTIAASDNEPKQTNFFMTKATEDGFTFLKCLLLPKSKQEGTECQKDWTSEIEEPPAGTLGSLDFPPGLPPPPGANNPLTYTISYKNTECTISESLIDVVTDRMRRYYPEEQGVGTRNFRQLWRAVQAEAIQGGVNPLFALTLWIEETAAGGAEGAAPMGCMYRGWQNVTDVQEATLRQTRCLASVANQTQDFLGFMCRYSGEERNRTTNHCSTFANNPNFTRSVRFWYDFLSLGQLSSCRLTSTLPSQ